MDYGNTLATFIFLFVVTFCVNHPEPSHYWLQYSWSSLQSSYLSKFNYTLYSSKAIMLWWSSSRTWHWVRARHYVMRWYWPPITHSLTYALLNRSWQLCRYLPESWSNSEVEANQVRSTSGYSRGNPPLTVSANSLNWWMEQECRGIGILTSAHLAYSKESTEAFRYRII